MSLRRSGVGLSTLLTAVNLALVIAVLAVVVTQATHLLRRLGDAQALGRVKLASSIVSQELDDMSGHLLATVRLLAERPTLAELVRSEDEDELREYLQNFRSSSEIGGCGVILTGRSVGVGSGPGTDASGGVGAPPGAGAGGNAEARPGTEASGNAEARPSTEASRDVGASGGVGTRPGAETGGDAEWPPFDLGANPVDTSDDSDESSSVKLKGLFAAARLARTDGPQIFWSIGDAEDLQIGAVTTLPGHPTALVATTRALDRSYLEEMELRVGASVTIVPRARFDAENRADLRIRALEDGTVVLQRMEDQDLYLAILPLPFAPSEGVFEVSLPGAGVSAAMAELRRSLLLLAILVAAGAAAVSILLGRRLASPLRDLTEAAARIGHGDFDSPIRQARGAEIGTLGLTMEEMRRRLVALTAELRRHRAEAETLLNGVLDGVFTVDRDRRICYVNPQAAALLGLEPPEILGRFCGDVLDPERVNGLRPCEDRCPILHARFRGTVRATEHLCLRRGSRQRTVVITSARPECDSPESTELVQFQMMRDETEVEATRRLRDLVVANISHEFRTPLAAQRASIELLHDRLLDLPQYEEVQGLMESLELGTLRLTWLIDNLLESARLEAGRTSIRRQPVALDQVIEEAVSLAAPLFAQRQQTVETALPFPLPAVMGDSSRLVQVFVNLLANANKFAPSGTTVRVGGEIEATDLVLWVEDDGPGIPGEDREMLFERFVRSPGEEPEAGGMGLGLWIVRSIVERHGGQVVASAGSRMGARFSIRLPLSQAEERISV